MWAAFSKWIEQVIDEIAIFLTFYHNIFVKVLP